MAKRVNSLFQSRGTGVLNLRLSSAAEYRYSLSEPYACNIEIAGAPGPERRTDGWLARWSYEASRPVSSRQARHLQILSAGQLPPGSRDASEGIRSAEGTWRTFPAIDRTGRFDPAKPAELQLLSGEIAGLFYGPGRADFSHVMRLATSLEWRTGCIDGPIRHKVTRTEWSIDGNAWRPWPNTLHVKIVGGYLPLLGPLAATQIGERLAVGAGEPSGHELLREAEGVLPHSLRAAAVLAAAALEVGAKECLAALAPDTESLVRHRTAPPPLELLTMHLPRFAERVPGRVVHAMPPRTKRRIEEGLKRRNRIVHANADPGDRTEVEDFVALVRDLLYLMDAYTGASWAEGLIRSEARDLLGLPPTECRGGGAN